MFSLFASLSLALPTADAAGEDWWPDISAPAETTIVGSRDAALIVAIEDYLIDEMPDIPGAAANGQDWYRYLVKGRGLSPSNVVLLQDRQATDAMIQEQAYNVGQRVGQDGTVWFIYIGHSAANKAGTDGLLIGSDAQPSEIGIRSRSVPQSDVLDLFEQGSDGRSSQTLAIIDSTFSGKSTKGNELVSGLMPAQAVNPSVSGSKTVVLTAGQSDQYAGSLPGSSRPAFSYLALGALRGWGDQNGDGAVTINEVSEYTKGAIQNVVVDRKQTPKLIGSGGNKILSTSQKPESGPDLQGIRRALAPNALPVQAPKVRTAANKMAMAATQTISSTPKQRPAPTPQPRLPNPLPQLPEPSDADYYAMDTGMEDTGIETEDGYEMEYIPAGEFRMGNEDGYDDEKPVHMVVLSHNFYMGKTEVTQGLWEEVMGSNPSRFKQCGEYCPVENITWYDAVKFANALSRRDGLEECYVMTSMGVTWPRELECEGYRLPTEAEWEYSARGGQYQMYAGSSDINSVGWYHDNSNGTTHPVGEKMPNGYELYDMSGNVWEWCWDIYDRDAYSKRSALGYAVQDPIESAAGAIRIYRGGAYNASFASGLRLGFRNRYFPSGKYDYLGLRLARTVIE